MKNDGKFRKMNPLTLYLTIYLYLYLSLSISFVSFSLSDCASLCPFYLFWTPNVSAFVRLQIHMLSNTISFCFLLNYRIVKRKHWCLYMHISSNLWKECKPEMAMPWDAKQTMARNTHIHIHIFTCIQSKYTHPHT